MLSNGRSYEIFHVVANRWYRLRVSAVDPLGASQELRFTPGCEVHRVASDGVWHSVVPFSSSTANKYQMTGSSRGDFALRCSALDPINAINILFGNIVAAIINVKQNALVGIESDLGRWQPNRPPSMKSMILESVRHENRLFIEIDRHSINGKEWNPDIPLGKLAFNEIHEWVLPDTRQHP